jgi:hypothetical protein
MAQLSVRKQRILTPRRKDANLNENAIGKAVVVNVAVRVNRELGPRLLETGYDVVLALELESVEQLSKVQAKQLLAYLTLRGLRLECVLNFGANLMKEGIERIVNGLPEEESFGVLA